MDSSLFSLTCSVILINYLQLCRCLPASPGADLLATLVWSTRGGEFEGLGNIIIIIIVHV